MPKRQLAQISFFALIFSALLVSFVDATLTPVAAQDESSTPEATSTATLEAVPPELPTVGPISISYPIHGQTLQGIVNITGSIAIEGWTDYELAFAYADQTTPNWFVFASGPNPIPNDSPLTIWDTTTLTDRDYNLRLRVFSPGGEQDVYVYGLRIRNYTVDTPLPTSTPTATITPPASPTASPTITLTPLPTATPYAMPTPMPPNPAILRTDQIFFNLGRGALFTGLLFGIFGLLLRLHRR